MYYIPRRMAPKKIEIAKFTDRKEPEAVYTIINGNCDCPARAKSCKHTSIAAAWLNNGEMLGIVFDENLNYNLLFTDGFYEEIC